MRNITHLVVHCTATPKNTTIASIRRHWKEGLGWKSVGYHKIVEPNGNILTLATDDKTTNGVAGHNATSLHVSYIGGKDTDDRTIQQMKVICLSTDKTVYPINAMGMTKALMEKVAQAAARTTGDEPTVVSVVRYGNVMYSRGSVIPLFVQQMKDRKPLTITEPRMTRFLLPLSEAVDLVLFAFEHGRQGDILIRKAPACTVADLVAAMKGLFCSEVPVKVIGVRHGEKLYETLATREELRRADDMTNYYGVAMDSRDVNYSKYFTEGDLQEAEVDDYTSHNTKRLNVQEVEALLRTFA